MKAAFRWLVVLIVITALVVFGGIGYMFYRQHVNDRRCEATLGSGAEYWGKDKCSPPAVRVGGLM